MSTPEKLSLFDARERLDDATNVLAFLQDVFGSIEAIQISETGQRGLIRVLYLASDSIGEFSETWNKMVGEPYTAGLSEGIARSDAAYKRGFDEGQGSASKSAKRPTVDLGAIAERAVRQAAATLEKKGGAAPVRLDEIGGADNGETGYGSI